MKNVKPKFSTDLDAANSWYLAWRSTSFRTNARFHVVFALEGGFVCLDMKNRSVANESTATEAIGKATGP
jgi:hypothetical protein